MNLQCNIPLYWIPQHPFLMFLSIFTISIFMDSCFYCFECFLVHNILGQTYSTWRKYLFTWINLPFFLFTFHFEAFFFQFVMDFYCSVDTFQIISDRFSFKLSGFFIYLFFCTVFCLLFLTDWTFNWTCNIVAQ